jgi:hypothetical protein
MPRSIFPSRLFTLVGAYRSALWGSVLREHHRKGTAALRCALAGLVATLAGASGASAADKPPLAPDTSIPLTTTSRVTAAIEFSVPALAAEIEREIPRRLATIDERVNCVHRRVLFFQVNANCDIWGHVDLSGPVTLSGRGDRLYGAVPIYAVVEGQGANRFTSRIHGDTEARVTIDVAARPQLNRDWSLNLDVSDGFHWRERPVLHVLGREISVPRYAEPKVREQMASVRSRVAEAARQFGLRAKAERAWREAFEPIQFSEDVWLQLEPQSAAFAGVRANDQVLSGALEYTGVAQTFVGARPPEVRPTPLPPLGTDVGAPGSFDMILPIHIDYETIKGKIVDMLKAESAVRDVVVYPSSGKLVLGLRISPNGGDSDWYYISAKVETDDNALSAHLADLQQLAEAGAAADPTLAPVIAQLKDKITFDYNAAYQELLATANEKLSRPLKEGFRMVGHIAAAKFDRIYLPADSAVIALRATGELKILYGM